MTVAHHLLTTTAGPDHFEDQEDFDFSIECVTPGNCSGWLACREDHTGAPSNPDLDEEAEFHGVLHTWRSGHGYWSVPLDGCIAQWGLNGSGVDYAWEIAHRHGLGVHDVDVDWDDFGMVLHHVKTVSVLTAEGPMS